jgi:SOS response regulatory protein OraA/RecX
MTNGAEEKLARVTYLPGVQIPTSAPFASDSPGSGSTSGPQDLPPKRLHNYPTGELERLTPEQLQQRMDEITRRPVAVSAEPELIVVEHDPEPPSQRSARAHNVSLSALARRGVSTAEMADLLVRRELDEGEIEVEISRLEAVGLLDDRQLAGNLVRTLRERKGLGRTAVSAELHRRRIDSAAIEDALEDAYDSGPDDLTRARELAIKRAPQLRSLDPETARRRLGTFLMRKGYSGSIVASAVAAALAPNHPTQRRHDGGGPRFQ